MSEVLERMITIEDDKIVLETKKKNVMLLIGITTHGIHVLHV